MSSIDLTFITGQVRKPTGGLVSTTLQLSAQTTPARVRTQIEHRLMKRGKDTLVGPRGKKVSEQVLMGSLFTRLYCVGGAYMVQVITCF